MAVKARSAGADQARPMTEDELLQGITEALTYAGWRWMHVRRSDLAVVQGDQGIPDLFAVHATRKIALWLELKAADGRLTVDQAAWIAAINQAGGSAITIRPSDYDLILSVIFDRPRELQL